MKRNALITTTILVIMLISRAEQAPPVQSSIPAKEVKPEVRVEIPEKNFSVPALPTYLPTFPQQKATVVDNTAEVLARLHRADMEVRILEVWSLDPSVPPDQEKIKKSRPYPFHGNYSLGRAELKNEEEIHKLLFSVILSIAHGPEVSNDCFDPRHGLRIYDQKGFVDVVLCFECLQGVMYDGKNELWFSIAADAGAEFDAVFAELGLKKAD